MDSLVTRNLKGKEPAGQLAPSCANYPSTSRELHLSPLQDTMRTFLS